MRGCGFVTNAPLDIKCGKVTNTFIVVTDHTGYGKPMLTEWVRCEDHLGPTISEFQQIKTASSYEGRYSDMFYADVIVEVKRQPRESA